MRIHSMTATFGKLEHETLTLQPGLNIIEAPNEWGKSTWCAFLIAMLYGIETRVHSTKTSLADKERYAPWSGAPMSGRIDLNWNGRDITIERRTKGRAIFGDFKAYETGSGLAIPELTAANCGQQLLGVERSVFQRAGFLKLTDLPVTQDESLRRRLNALVTTGDESGAADELAQKLKDLKNRCRFNKSGLLPQAEAQRAELDRKLRELDALQSQSRQLRERRETLDSQIAALENHKAALQYADAQEDTRRVAAAQDAKRLAETQLDATQQACAGLPSEDQTRQAVDSLQDLQHQLSAAQEQLRDAPQPPSPPQAPAPFRGMNPEDAKAKAEKDGSDYRARAGVKPFLRFLVPIGGCAIVALAVAILTEPKNAIVPAVLAVLTTLICVALTMKLKARRTELAEYYSSADPNQWLALAQQYDAAQRKYLQDIAACEDAQALLRSRQEEIQKKITDITGGIPVRECLEKWQQVLSAHAAYGDAQKEHQRAVSLLAVTQAMAKTAHPPKLPDTLAYSEEETARRLADAQYEQRQLEMKLGQCLGQMERLGNEKELRQQLEAVSNRIIRLEDTYAALSIAQQTLAAATAELQRRFAPRISQRAQALFSQLTDHRYDRLTLAEDLSLQAGAQGEDTLHAALWRSDGTVDQLYLALRLAVAEALTHDAPLILDDALVRFDDKRLAAAMKILRQEAETKQVILFTCQGREKNV